MTSEKLVIFMIEQTQESDKMSFTMNIYYKGQNGSAKEFANEMISSGLVEEIRNKEGNLKYEYYEPLEDNETILLIDSWKDQESLDKHHKSETMNKIIELRNKYDLHMSVEKYILAESNNKNDKYIRKQVKNEKYFNSIRAY